MYNLLNLLYSKDIFEEITSFERYMRNMFFTYPGETNFTENILRDF